MLFKKIIRGFEVDECVSIMQVFFFSVVSAILIATLIGFVKLIILLFPYWLRFWSYKEIRMMVAACAVICFAFVMIPSKMEIKMIHEFSTKYGNPIELRLNHDFAGNMHKPIIIHLSDPGWPIKLDITNR